MTRWIGLVALCALLACAGAAQTQTPGLTEVQTLRLQNLALKAQSIEMQVALLQQAMQQVVQERQALIAEIEREHPGWTLNPQTGKLEAKPAQVAPKK